MHHVDGLLAAAWLACRHAHAATPLHLLLPRAGSARQVQVMRQTQADQVFTTPNQEIAVLSKRWRAERNLWLSAFAFSSWV